MQLTNWKRVAGVLGLGVMLAAGGCADADQTAATSPVSHVATSGSGDLPACCAADADADPAKAAHAEHLAKADGEAHACEFCEAAPSDTADPADAPAATPLADITAPAPKQDDAASVASEWTAPADRVGFYLDFEVENQDGEAMNMTALRGKPVAMSFIFTRCPNPRMCPLIASTMAELQDILAARGLTDDVQLVLVTYDPTYDTPERLKAYGAKFGLAYTNAVMLRAQGATFREMLSEFSVVIGPGAGGLLNHRNELLLLDREGRYVRDYRGDVWDATAVADDLAKLIAETPPAQAQ